MAIGSSRKRRKSSQTKRKIEVDRISTLPDELLSHVLSFLETKEAVATSVLSTRWRSLWTLVPTLDFKDDNNCSIHVVGNVLAQRKTESIKRLCLLSHHKRLTPNIVNLLVSIAVTKNLEELDLSFFYLEATLPSRLFTCQTISILKLVGNINLNLPSSIHLPLLKILHLYLIYFIDDESIMRLLSGCPILEELFYGEVALNRSSSFGICVPSLKTLHVKSMNKGLRIDTPMLEFLQLEETTVIEYSVGNMDNLVEAYVDIFFDYEDGKENIPNLFGGIHKTRFLHLSHCATEVLTWACLEFPIFHNLVHLQLILSTLDSYFLVELLLGKCPKLEFLEIKKVDEESEIEWTEPTVMVPSCLSSHLTKFTFMEYGGSKEELEFVGYILKSAKVLKTTTVHISKWLRPKKRDKALSKLCALPRGSKDCHTDYEIIG